MTIPPYLSTGDKVAITCPGKKLPSGINDAVKLLETWGLEVLLGKTVTASFNQYAGTDELRTEDLQKFLDDASVKAIIAARGGYGTIRIIDRLDFRKFTEHPKWMVGFSDITVLHSHIQANFQIETIHGQMPVNIPDGTKPSFESLRKALFGEALNYSFKNSPYNRAGSAEGILTGGNLTLLVMLSASVSEVDLKDKILFIEDVGEYLYSVDRMMWQLSRAGKLKDLKGMIVGGFTGIKDNDIPFGQRIEEIICEHVKDYDFPVCFDFPAGHIPDNFALLLGRKISFQVTATNSSVRF